MSPTSEHEHETSPTLELLARLGETATPTSWEPSAWLRTRATAAALALAADGGPFRPGVNVIVPLIPAPEWAAEHRPAHVCARCGRWTRTERPEPGTWRSCGLEATSDAHPGAVLKFVFELDRQCARKEFGPDAV